MCVEQRFAACTRASLANWIPSFTEDTFSCVEKATGVENKKLPVGGFGVRFGSTLGEVGLLRKIAGLVRGILGGDCIDSGSGELKT